MTVYNYTLIYDKIFFILKGTFINYMGNNNKTQQNTDRIVRKKTDKNKQKKKTTFKGVLFSFIRFCLGCLFLGIIVASVGAVLLSLYLVDVTKDDDVLLDLDNLELSYSSIIYAKDPETDEWIEYQKLVDNEDRVWKELNEIPLNLQNAFIAAEDEDFRTHSGVNLKRTVYAGLNEVSQMVTGQYFAKKQGASTITQQLIKNLIDDNASSGMDGYLRKIRELFRAYILDNKYGKDRILEAYLNTIPLTGIQGGVEVGARDFFGVGVEDLTLAQCASIAGITNAPSAFNPRTQPEQHIERRNYVLWQMFDTGMISEIEYDNAINESLILKEVDREGEKSISDYSYHTDLMKEFNITEDEAFYNLYNKGYSIYSTVDLKLQNTMEKYMVNDFEYGEMEYDYIKEGTGMYPDKPITIQLNENGTPMVDKWGIPVIAEEGATNTETLNVQGAMAILNYDGEIAGIVGGVGEKEGMRVHNRASDSQLSIGSTMKPIGVYALGIELDQFNYSTSVVDNYIEILNGKEWPVNYSGTYTEKGMLISDAISNSINTVAVQSLLWVGVDTSYDFLTNTLQIESIVPEDKAKAPLALGSLTNGMTAIELASAYMMFGNGGYYVTPHSYISVENSSGDIILEPEVTITKAISEETAMIMNKMLGRVLVDGTASSGGGKKVKGGMDSAGKTGTTSDNKDHWFAGLTPYYVTASWMGYDVPYPLYWRGIYLNHPPTNVWKVIMEEVQEGKEIIEFPASENVVQITYCKETGAVASAACPQQAVGYYKADGSQPATVCPVHK